jgi:hypothetical protein
MARKPPPTANCRFALPRRLTTFGQVTDTLSSLLMRGDLPGAGEECDRVLADLEEELELAEAREDDAETDFETRRAAIDQERLQADTGALERVRAMIREGRKEDALAMLTRDSFDRRPGDIKKAYKAAMERTQ